MSFEKIDITALDSLEKVVICVYNINSSKNGGTIYAEKKDRTDIFGLEKHTKP